MGRFLQNSSGQTAFAARLNGTGVDLTNNMGVFRQAGEGEPQLVAREGDHAPGTDSTFVFWSEIIANNRFEGPAFNDRGHTAFSTYLMDPGDTTFPRGEGIFSEGAGRIDGLSLATAISLLGSTEVRNSSLAYAAVDLVAFERRIDQPAGVK